MDTIAKSLLLALVVLIAGCVQSPAAYKEGRFSVKLEASSGKVFQGETTTLYIDAQNSMAQDAKNVVADVFGEGLFEKAVDACTPPYACSTACKTGEQQIKSLGKDCNLLCCGPDPCSKDLGTIKQGELQIATCKLSAKKNDMLKDEAETTLWAKVSFSSRLQASQVMKLISKNEFEIRQKSGTLEKEPDTFTYHDDNIELTVAFSSEMPIVKKGTREFVTFKVKNIGNGFVKSIELGKDFRFVQNPNGIVNEACLSGIVGPLNNEFPAITCELKLPEINYLSNLILIINIDYQYEVRESLPLKIIR